MSATGMTVTTERDGLLSVVSPVESIFVGPMSAMTLFVYCPAGVGMTARKVSTLVLNEFIVNGLAQCNAWPTMVGSARGTPPNVALPGMKVGLPGVEGN